jgi:nicotinate-nucleotide adenylyltransferase
VYKKIMNNHPTYTKNRTIGLLGGSFNPAHAGHLHITLHALNKLHFDEVWWLVAPQNPLKSAADLASYEQRVESARRVVAGHSRIRVLDIEARLRTRYTVETVMALQSRFGGARLVWMMGADNLASFHRWKRWQWLLAHIPVVVFDRAPYSHTSLRSKTMLRGQKFLLKNMDIGAEWRVPCLVFEHLKRNPLSSSTLRKKLGLGAFLGHNKNVGQT